jgi:DNA-binding transcriptional MerR regulator
MASLSSIRAERSYSIRQLCREFGATPRALRFYEDKGLLAPRREGQTRRYNPRDRARLQLIVLGKRVGFSLGEIGELLDLYDAGDGGATQISAAIPKFRLRIAALESQRDEIDTAIALLQDGCAQLERRLAEVRPDLLPRAADYDSVLRAGLDDLGPTSADHSAKP